MYGDSANPTKKKLLALFLAAGRSRWQMNDVVRLGGKELVVGQEEEDELYSRNAVNFGCIRRQSGMFDTQARSSCTCGGKMGEAGGGERGDGGGSAGTKSNGRNGSGLVRLCVSVEPISLLLTHCPAVARSLAGSLGGWFSLRKSFLSHGFPRVQESSQVHALSIRDTNRENPARRVSNLPFSTARSVLLRWRVFLALTKRF